MNLLLVALHLVFVTLYSFASHPQARVLIDISFHHYETFPALEFVRKSMETIHNLYVSISIALY